MICIETDYDTRRVTKRELGVILLTTCPNYGAGGSA